MCLLSNRRTASPKRAGSPSCWSTCCVLHLLELLQASDMVEEIEDGELRDDEDEIEPSPTNDDSAKVEAEKREEPIAWRKEENNIDLDCTAKKLLVKEIEWNNRLNSDLHCRLKRDLSESQFEKDEGTYSSNRESDNRKRGWKRKRGRRNRHKEEMDRKRLKKERRNHHSRYTNSNSCMGDNDRSKEGIQDDYELVFVRGASPVPPEEDCLKRENSYNSSSFDHDLDEQGRRETTLKQDGKEQMGDARSSQKSGKHSLSRSEQHSRKKKSKKSSKTKKRNHTSKPSGSNANICTYFLQGKCNKKNDCQFSHEACLPRKLEVCRYYLMDVCAKKDKCLYMHQDFPCKFFHTGMKCFSGDKCKFSHGTLSETMKNVLFKGVQTWPSQEVHQNVKSHGPEVKKIPSLFDIEVPIPPLLSVAQRDHRKEASPKGSSLIDNRNEGQDGTLTPMPLSPANDGNIKGMNRLWGSDDSDIIAPGNSSHRSQDCGTESINTTSRKENPISGGISISKLNGGKSCGSIIVDQKAESISSDPNKILLDIHETKGDNGRDNNDFRNLPLHLPKKQLELFLRIQKHQREAEISNDATYSDKFGVAEDKCCSSDDEDSLTNIMENISKRTQGLSGKSSLLNLSQNVAAAASNLEVQDLAKIQSDESVIKLLSSIDLKNILDTASATPNTTVFRECSNLTPQCTVRDPRRAREVTSRGAAPISEATRTSGGQPTTISSNPTKGRTTIPYIPNSKPLQTQTSSALVPFVNKKCDNDNRNRVDCTSGSKNGRSHLVSSIYCIENLKNNISVNSEEGNTSSDTDLRKGIVGNAPDLCSSRKSETLTTYQSPVRLPFGDVDLRLTSPELTVAGPITSSTSQDLRCITQKDVDWRKFPFKPVPVHTPATEIEASFLSHPPIPYHLKRVTIPKPDFSSMKLSIMDQQVHKDPRLRKIFNSQYLGNE